MRIFFCLLLGLSFLLSFCHEKQIPQTPVELFHQQDTIKLMLGQASYTNSSRYVIDSASAKLAIIDYNFIEIWDIPTGIMQGKYSIGVHSLPQKCRFSADNKEIIIYRDKNLVFWDMATKKEVICLDNVFQVSPNLSYFIQKDSTSGYHLYSIKAPFEAILSFSLDKMLNVFSGNERYLLDLHPDTCNSVIYDIEEGGIVFQGKIEISSRYVALSNDGSKIAIGEANPAGFCIASIIDSTQVDIIRVHLSEAEQAPKSMFFSGDSQLLCFRTYEPSINIYDTENLELLYKEKSSYSNDIIVIDSSYFLYYNQDIRSTILLDQKNITIKDTLPYFSNINTSDLNNFGLIKENSLYLYHLRQQSWDTLLIRPLERIRTSIFNKNEEILKSSHFIFDIQNLEPISNNKLAERYHPTIKIKSNKRNNGTYSPNWKYYFANDTIWDCISEKVIMTLPRITDSYNSSRSLQFSSSGERLLTYHSTSEKLVILDLKNKTILVNEHLTFPEKILFSPLGDSYIIQKISKRLNEISIHSLGKEITPPAWLNEYYEYESSSIAISPDGEYIALACHNKDKGGLENTIWSITTGVLLYKEDASLYKYQHERANSILFLHEPGEIISVSGDSLRRISFLTKEIRWTQAFKGIYSKFTSLTNGKAFFYEKDEAYYCMADLETGEDIWEMGVLQNKQYFIKSSKWPTVYTNSDNVLNNFYYFDKNTHLPVFPLVDEIRDTSHYLLQLTKQYME